MGGRCASNRVGGLFSYIDIDITPLHHYHTSPPLPHPSTITTPLHHYHTPPPLPHPLHHYHTPPPSPHLSTITTPLHHYHTPPPSSHPSTITTPLHHYHTPHTPPLLMNFYFINKTLGAGSATLEQVIHYPQETRRGLLITVVKCELAQ